VRQRLVKKKHSTLNKQVPDGVPWTKISIRKSDAGEQDKTTKKMSKHVAMKT
jgi:hypothetical protein